MLKKTQSGNIELKADQPGQFRATFSTFNVIDRDKDVVIPGAFKSGQEVRIAAWGHNWDVPAIGKGVIDQDDSRAWVDGEFFLNTTGGKEHYESVKQLGGLQQWSYGYEVLESAPGVFEEQDVVFLRALDVVEVSPVMMAASVGTRTDAIKSAKEQHDALTALRKQAVGMLASIDAALIGPTESRDAVNDEAGDGKSESGDGVKDGGERFVLPMSLAAELELLSTT